jgi:hypothetical protein
MKTLALTVRLFKFYRAGGMGVVPAIRKTMHVVNRGF